LIVAVVLFSAGGVAGFQIGRRWERREVPIIQGGAQAVPADAPAAPPPTEQVAAAPAPGTASPAAPAPSAPGAGAPTPTVPGAPPAAVAGVRRVSAELRGALEQSLASAMPPADRPYAEQLTQVVNRLLVWNIQVARQGLKGDRIEVLWEPPPQNTGLASGLSVVKEPIVHAVRYGSQKLGKEIAAYRFQPEGARWARYYQADGTELEERLVDGPIGEYEQVTSLLRDGRKHAGVDFKTPTGTPVVAPFDGTVVKKNWNWRFNGNSLEIAAATGGRRAIFLHLDELPKDVVVGRKVRKGEVIAASGNTGRSYAPHLHYQLEDANGKVLDPFEVHQTRRVALQGEHKAAFDAARARLEPQLAAAP
jgi:murein DD-endopeptidase MepM/ murein hydrolase activator NlpD